MARHGENIRKRKDGRWEGRYKVFDENRGRGVYRSLYGKTYEEVKEKLFLVRSGLAGPDRIGEDAGEKTDGTENMPYPGGAVLFSQAAEQWLVQVKKERKYSTFAKYDTVYRTHLKGRPAPASFPRKKPRNVLQRFLTTYQKKSCQGACRKASAVWQTRFFISRTKNIPPMFLCWNGRR